MRYLLSTAIGAAILAATSPFEGVSASGFDDRRVVIREYAPGPPDLWRQREQAYDAIFTREHRIIYDANLAAQNRQAAAYYALPPRGYRSRMKVYYWSPPRGPYAPPLVRYYMPPETSGNCGTFGYWNGAGCVDARYQSRYVNPYKWRF